MFKINRLFKSFYHAGHGIVKAFKEEQNFKIDLIGTFFIISVSLILKIKISELIIIILCCGLVMTLELVNTAIEAVSDLLKPRLNCYIKEVKDLIAGAVLMIGITSVIIASLIFYPYIYNLYKFLAV